MIQFPNRTSQTGIYRAGPPSTLDVANFALLAAAGMFTFGEKAADDAWEDGDTVGVEVRTEEGAYLVGAAIWDGATETLQMATVEDASADPALADGDTVTVTAIPTAGTLMGVVRGPELIEESSAARALSARDKGATIRCTSADAVTITLSDDLPVGFHALIVQEGAGAVSVAPGGADTLNGATDPVSIAEQYRSAYVYQAAEGGWVVLV